ncbi:MAG: 2-hydroxyacyl-CoA dehydratase family protein [Dehalococcoidales bacterium]|nr:2-hydroxyacyl-CoA dehydratase family protein [Dehalococcoidales bacterium]
MVAVAQKGFTRIQELYQNRPQRVRELKAEGKTIFGYLCLYPVLEMLTALDIVPYRVLGDMREPITKADKYLPPVVCPFLRSCLDLGLKDKYDFLDGMVTSHICDVGSGVSGIWNYTVKTPYHYNIDTPHTAHETALAQEKNLLRAFRTSLEEYTGKQLTDAQLKKAIALHNQQRALVRELYELKRLDPPLLSGAETVKIIKVIQSIPIDEGNDLLRQIIAEAKTRKNGPLKKAARLLIWGSIIDDTAFLEMVESLAANVVVDDTCVGSRPYFQDIKATVDPIDGLAEHYLVSIRCPRTFQSKNFYDAKKNYLEDLQSRFGYLSDYVRDWQVNGAILESVRYCDTHGYEVPQVKDYLNSIGIPSIYLEHDYTEGALAQMRTRVQGFLEIIG